MNLLISDYVALFLCILLGFLLTLGVLSKHKWLNATCYILATAVFAVHILDSIYDYLWVWLIPHPTVAIVHLLAVWGPIIAILVGLSTHLPRKGDRKALMIIAALVGMYGLYVVGRQLVPPGEAADSLWIDGVLLQSTGTTCIAAASCTYLRQLGVAMDEPEAVRKGVISPNGGTNVNAWRILRLGLAADYQVKIGRPSREQMAQSGRWYITAMHLSLLTGHEIVFQVSPDGEEVNIKDPLVGRYTYTWEKFSEDWLKTCVWAERVGDG